MESLNSVLDDNRLLTMPSGERIQFGPNVNFIFETHDLKFASPATVSRMGMIFLDEVLDPTPLTRTPTLTRTLTLTLTLTLNPNPNPNPNTKTLTLTLTLKP